MEDAAVAGSIFHLVMSVFILKTWPASQRSKLHSAARSLPAITPSNDVSFSCRLPSSPRLSSFWPLTSPPFYRRRVIRPTRMSNFFCLAHLFFLTRAAPPSLYRLEVCRAFMQFSCADGAPTRMRPPLARLERHRIRQARSPHRLRRCVVSDACACAEHDHPRACTHPCLKRTILDAGDCPPAPAHTQRPALAGLRRWAHPGWSHARTTT